MHYDYGPMMDRGEWVWGLIMMLIWIVILTIIAVVALRYLRGHEQGAGSNTDPLGIAKERYAKGEITRKQFEKLKQALK